jgi:hypothetical protein
MKKLLALSACAFVLATVVGCTGASSATTSTTTTKTTNVTK